MYGVPNGVRVFGEPRFRQFVAKSTVYLLLWNVQRVLRSFSRIRLTDYSISEVKFEGRHNVTNCNFVRSLRRMSCGDFI